VVAQSCNPCTLEAETQDQEFEASVVYTVGHYLKKNRGKQWGVGGREERKRKESNP
jgi:hypothetical protein